MNIFEQNYKAVQDRGLITKETRNYDFLKKAKEEYEECEKAYLLYDNYNLNEEITDLMNVCSNWLIFRLRHHIRDLHGKQVYDDHQERCQHNG